MTEARTSATDDDDGGGYEICIKGHLDQRWADRLEGLTFRHESNGTTTLHGPVADQAALHGVLNRIRDLGIPIISVQRISPTERASGEETS